MKTALDFPQDSHFLKFLDEAQIPATVKVLRGGNSVRLRVGEGKRLFSLIWLVLLGACTGIWLLAAPKVESGVVFFHVIMALASISISLRGLWDAFAYAELQFGPGKLQSARRLFGWGLAYRFERKNVQRIRMKTMVGGGKAKGLPEASKVFRARVFEVEDAKQQISIGHRLDEAELQFLFECVLAWKKDAANP